MNQKLKKMEVYAPHDAPHEFWTSFIINIP